MYFFFQVEDSWLQNEKNEYALRFRKFYHAKYLIMDWYRLSRRTIFLMSVIIIYPPVLKGVTY